MIETAVDSGSGGAPAPPSGPRIAYLLSLFPCYDETFILREIAALDARGVALRIYSLRSRSDPFVQEAAKPFLAVTRYCAWFWSAEVLLACARALGSRPIPIAGLVWQIVRGCWRRPVTLAKSLAILPKALRFAEIAQADGIEHIHAHWATYPSTVALVIARLNGIPWSFTCHAHDIFLDPSLLGEKLASAAFVLTCTADNKRHLEGISSEARAKVRVAYHGLDITRFRPRSDPGDSARAEILSVGSLLECKGFAYLIDAARLLKARGVEFHLTIAGGGPLETSLRERASGLGDVLTFTGYIKQEALISLYRAADIFALPAVLEIHWGIPNVLIESLACGVPVVTTPLPSLPELVADGVEGLVVRNRDAADLAEKLELLARNASLRQRLGRAGRKKVEDRFDLERTIEDVVAPLLAQLPTGVANSAGPAPIHPAAGGPGRRGEQAGSTRR